MIKDKGTQRVKWTPEHRFQLAGAMAQLVHERGTGNKFPFKSIFLRSQQLLRYEEQGIYRKYYAQEEVKEFKAVIYQLLNHSDLMAVEPPVIQQLVTGDLTGDKTLEIQNDSHPDLPIMEVEMAIKLLDHEDDSMSILQRFIDSAANLGKLLISECELRRVLDIKVLAQQRLLETQTFEIQSLRKSVDVIEEYITRPMPVNEVKSTAETLKNEIDSHSHGAHSKTLNVATTPCKTTKKPRIFIVGMLTRNHAVFKTEYGLKLDLRFYCGTKKSGSIKPREEDIVLIAVDFCSHTIYNAFMDNMKRRGFKNRVMTVNGGMTAMSSILQQITDKTVKL